jgi:hypothetical protein
MSNEPGNEGFVVEFTSGPGLKPVAVGPAELMQRSGKAVGDAMEIIKKMSESVRTTVDGLVHRPSEVEVAFGIKFDMAAGAVLAKAGVESAILVTLRWSQDRGSHPPIVRDRADADRLFELGILGGMG